MSTHENLLPGSVQMATLGPPRVRSVFCVIEHAYRSRQIADDACSGVFTNAGQTIDMGTEIEWESPLLPVDEEWAIEWYKFYFGLDLAQAFKTTQENVFLSTWKKLVRSWIEQRPVYCNSSDVIARRITNWIYAWNIFADSLEQSSFDSFETELIASISAQARHLRRNLTAERNHRTLELYALLIVALAIPEIDEEMSLLSFAVHNLAQNLLCDIRPDGVHREQSTHYHMTALRCFLGGRENARRFGFDMPEGYDDRLLKACEFALHVHRPDGLIPALSDSDTGSYLELLHLAADLFGREDFRFVATRGLEGTTPAAAHSSFQNGGYYIQRSGWGSNSTDFQDQRYLILDCGPLGDGGHGHYDLLNVEIYAQRRPLIVDPGRFTYCTEDAANFRRAFKGTAAHNTVCVDGLDQTAFYPGKPKQPAAKVELLSRLTADGFDMICGEVTSACYDAHHTRRIFFVANEYWVIVDSLRANQAHTFDLRFHLTPDAWNHCAIFKSKHNVTLRTPDVALVFDSQFHPNIEPGWVSSTYGIKHLAPVVSVVSKNTTTDFVSVVYPTTLRESVPDFRVISESIDLRDSGLIEITGSGSKRSSVDQIAWGNSTTRFHGSNDCQLAWKRIDAHGVESLTTRFESLPSNQGGISEKYEATR
ncbi:MAG TPA: alginate lyase family protein [Pyrinomonadaceae bacterium]|nr:alginate lyase family protein [Pyrinomonadaceae bacterium]